MDERRALRAANTRRYAGDGRSRFGFGESVLDAGGLSRFTMVAGAILLVLAGVALLVLLLGV